MKRWVKNLFCLFSLLVFASSATVWVRSYFAFEGVDYQMRRTDTVTLPAVTCVQGCGLRWSQGAAGLYGYKVADQSAARVHLGWVHYKSAAPAPMIWPTSPLDRFNVQYAGFALVYATDLPSPPLQSLAVVQVPLWVFLPAGVPPFLWWRRWTRNRGRGFEVLAGAESAAPPPPTAAGRPTPPASSAAASGAKS